MRLVRLDDPRALITFEKKTAYLRVLRELRVRSIPPFS